MNVYGDEVSQNMRGVNAAVMSATENGILTATGGLVNIRNVLNLLFPTTAPTKSQYEALLAQYAPFPTFSLQRTHLSLPNDTYCSIVLMCY